MAKLTCTATGVVVEVTDEKAAARMKKGGFEEVAQIKPAPTKKAAKKE